MVPHYKPIAAGLYVVARPAGEPLVRGPRPAIAGPPVHPVAQESDLVRPLIPVAEPSRVRGPIGLEGLAPPSVEHFVKVEPDTDVDVGRQVIHG